jgi:hypothetical protein
MTINYIRKYDDCPLQNYKDVVGSDFIEKIVSKISCAGWKQIHCSKCGAPINGAAYEYCGRECCSESGKSESGFDNDFS